MGAPLTLDNFLSNAQQEMWDSTQWNDSLIRQIESTSHALAVFRYSVEQAQKLSTPELERLENARLAGMIDQMRRQEEVEWFE